MSHIPDNSFAAACYNGCLLIDLEDALRGPAAFTADRQCRHIIECHQWGLTEAKWRASIELAIAAKREDLDRIPRFQRTGE